MAKRKRDPQDDGTARKRDPKKLKEQHLEEMPEKEPEPKLEISSSDDGSEQRQHDGGRTLAENLTKKERRKLKKERQAALEPQYQSRKEKEETGTGIALAPQEPKKQKLEPEDSAAEAGGPDDKVNGIVPPAAIGSRKRKHKAVSSAAKEQKAVSKSYTAAMSRHKQMQMRKNEQSSGETSTQKLAWKVSDPVGGHLLNTDPIFSRDEKYLLVAYCTAITVYSTSTSLPVRRLRANKSDRVSAFALSFSCDNQLYMSTASGDIEKWDWTEGLRLNRWKLSSSIYCLTTSTDKAENSFSEIIYTVDKKDADQWLISAHQPKSADKTAQLDAKTLLKHQGPLSSLKILGGGAYVVATSGSQLIIGNTKKPNPPILKDLSYKWYTVECPEWITCMDAQISHPMKIEKPSKGGARRLEALDIAVGGLKGSIHVYGNLLGKLVRATQPLSKESPEDIKSRRLHWHRNAVLSLKWSLDGNYLISGGHETVLVLWQLDTGRRQDIPHLGAPIESIVVSPFGASYGIRLADNSALILSTSELAPTFSIAGIQIPSARDESALELPFIPTVDAPRQRTTLATKPNYPACVSTSRPFCLLLAVPPSTSSRQTSAATPSASYLQSFDVRAAHQISRQALTRTKITDLNMGPESNTIQEPNVIHMQTSIDGQWLATVDVWTPPRRDLEPLAFNPGRLVEEQTFREEIYLKFWSWHDDAKVWELVSRVDKPHASQYGNLYEHGDVLQLSSDPSSVGFATIGADGIVRTWKPAIRRRHGLDVRDKEGKNLTSWHCKHVIPLESNKISRQNHQSGARLAYSQDGSILVAGLQTDLLSPLYILDTYIGEIRSLKTGLYAGPLCGLGIINKYLITLSNDLCVWDLVSEELTFGIHLDLVGNISPEYRMASSHLAVNFQHGIFAIALPKRRHNDEDSSKSTSQIFVFDPTNVTPLYQTSVPNAITALLPVPGRRDFYAIDSAAEVRTLRNSPSLPQLTLAPSEDEKAPSRGLRDIFGNGQSTRSLENAVGMDDGPLTSKFERVVQAAGMQQDTAVVVSKERLAEVFAVGPAYPPVMDMFEQVASLYNGREAS